MTTATNNRTSLLEKAFRVVLGGLAAAYISLGFYTLLFDTSISFPVDLRLRWIEQGMVYQRLNPQDHTYPEHLLPENVNAQKNVRGSYPPWSYATSVALVPPLEWRAARVYFAVLNLIALSWVVNWTYHHSEKKLPGHGVTVVALTLAIFAFGNCLSYGQYSIVVLALVLACLHFLERGAFAAAGFALGVAAVKPQLVGLYFLIPLIFPFPFKRKVAFFAGATFYLAASSFALAAWVGSTPWDMLSGTANESIKFYRLSISPLVVWAADIFGFALGSKLLAVSMAGLCAAMLIAIRRCDNLLAPFGICAMMAMFWSYSRHYDLVLMMLPLLELLRLWRLDGARIAGVTAALLAGLLWLPIRIAAWKSLPVQLAYVAVCALTLTIIVIQERRLASARVRTRNESAPNELDVLVNNSALTVG